MVETHERETLLASMKAYLEELLESGVDELEFGEVPVQKPAAVAPPTETSVSAAGVAAAGTASEPGPAPDAARAPDAAKAADAAKALDAGCDAVGNPKARLVFLMRGDGFEGSAGELQGKIVQAMGFATSDVRLLTFSGTIPGREAVLRQIAEVEPEVVVAAGAEAAQLLLDSREGIERLRGKFIEVDGVPVMATLHPEAMLEDPGLKRDVWKEMQQVMRRLSQPSLSH